MVSSSVRSRLGGVRLIGTGSSVIAPPSSAAAVGVRLVLVAVHADVDFVEQAAQQPFSVFVGGARRRPHAGENHRRGRSIADFSCGVRVFGRAASRRASSCSASSEGL